MRREAIGLRILINFILGVFFPFDSILACSQFDLVITEILADPTPNFGLPDAEFIEIYNRSSQSILLSDIKLNEGSSRDLPPIYIDAGEYVIICDDNDTSLFTGYGKVAWVTSMTLTNSGESIYLSCNSGIIIDSLNYSSSWYNSSFKEEGGWSLERIDKEFTCYNPSNWEPSTDISGGTPGSVNSIAGLFKDIEPPVPLNAYQIDSTQIVIEFSEHILLPNHLNQIYISNLGPLQVINHFGGQKDKLSIIIAQPLSQNVVYQVLINDIMDCSGNLGSIDTLFFGIIDTSVGLKRITVNEILFDPNLGCPEFIELKNSSKSIIDLADYKTAIVDIENGDIKATYDITNNPYTMIPEAIVVLCASPEILSVHYNTPYPRKMIEPIDMGSLTNKEGRLAIMQEGIISDDVYYNESYHHLLLAQTKGISLERISIADPTTGISNWHSTSSLVGYATPGFQNSHSLSNEVNEDWVSVSPKIFSPDNDGIDDLATITINSFQYGAIVAFRIFDIHGSQMRSYNNILLSLGTNRIIWNGTDDLGQLIPKGPYIILTELFTPDGHLKTRKDLVVVNYN